MAVLQWQWQRVGFVAAAKNVRKAQYIQQVLDKAFRSALERLNRPENYFKTETEQII
jgi:hypothetical protein